MEQSIVRRVDPFEAILENCFAVTFFLIQPIDANTSCFLCLLAYEKHVSTLTTCLVGVTLTNLSFPLVNTNLKVGILPF